VKTLSCLPQEAATVQLTGSCKLYDDLGFISVTSASVGRLFRATKNILTGKTAILNDRRTCRKQQDKDFATLSHIGQRIRTIDVSPIKGHLKAYNAATVLHVLPVSSSFPSSSLDVRYVSLRRFVELMKRYVVVMPARVRGRLVPAQDNESHDIVSLRFSGHR
jgi:hypothetical protein